MGIVALSIPFALYYFITYHDQINWIFHLDAVHPESKPVTCSVKDVAARVRGRGGFIAESALKGWGLFAAMPFLAGLLTQALFKFRMK